MIKDILKRFLALSLAMLMIMSCVPASVLTAQAAEISGLTVSNLKVQNTDGHTWTASGDTLSGSVTGTAAQGGCGSDSANSATLELTNTGPDAVLSFNYEFSNGGSLGGAISGTNGKYSQNISAGASIEITITSPKGYNTCTLSLTGISLVPAGQMLDVTFMPAVGGSYTVTDASGTVKPITENTVLSQDATKKYTLTATASEGYTFLGWYSVTEESYISYAATAELLFSTDPQLKPIFGSTSASTYSVGNAKFDDLAEAAKYAVSYSTKQINLLKNATVTGNHTIPAGVTLLVPFDSGYTCYTTEPDTIGLSGNAYASGTIPNAWQTPHAYRTLTLAAGATITVNGAISVSAKHSVGNSSGMETSGSPSGPCGWIDMKAGSKIILENGSSLYAWGYIVGQGEIEAKSGSTVYENMQFTDFRGGTATSAMATAYMAFPMSQYYVQNIEVLTKYHAGANEYVYVSIFMSRNEYHATAKFMGEGGMFQATDGYVTKDYIEGTDRLKIVANGDTFLSSLSMRISYVSINSAMFVLPINSNIDIEIAGGTTTVNQSICMLPGSTLTVDQGATLNLAYKEITSTSEGLGVAYVGAQNLIIYDANNWTWGLDLNDENFQTIVTGNFVHFAYRLRPIKYSAANGTTVKRSESSLVDVVFDINGTVITEGYLYTTTTADYTGNGASITSSGGTGIIQMNNGAGPDDMTVQANYANEEVVYLGIPMVSAMLKNGDGSYTQTADAVAGDAFYYSAAQNKWLKAVSATVTYNANGGEGTIDPAVVSKETIMASGSGKVTLPASGFTRSEYEFIGWNTAADGTGTAYAGGQDIDVSADMTLFAQWKDTKVTHIWYDLNSGVLEQQRLDVGETPTAPAAPEKPADAQYTYTFKEWVPTTSDDGMVVTYIPTYTNTINKYTVTWVNADGTTLKQESVEYGVTPSYTGATPTKAADAQYTYTFKGWSPEITAVTKDVTYTATYGSTVNKYTVTWNNEDGTLLKQDTVEYGATPSYTGETPTKAADAQYTYTFKGWDKQLSAVTGNVEYKAVYETELNSYTITWVVDEQEISETYYYGSSINYPRESPAKAGENAHTTYTFDGWEDASGKVYYTETESLPTVTGAATYTAHFAKNVTGHEDADLNHVCSICNEWVGGEHKPASSETHNCAYCKKPAEDCKGGTANCSNKAVCSVCGEEYGELDPSTHASADEKYVNNNDGTHTSKRACCEEPIETVAHSYTEGKCICEAVQTFAITWKNGESVLTVISVEYGSVPVYPEADPTKDGDGVHTTYTFTGWSPEIVKATDNAVYTAQFEPVVAACIDVSNDGNHQCDVCGKENVTTCAGGTATCIAKAVCTECGKEYGEKNPGNHDSTAVEYCNIDGSTHTTIRFCCKSEISTEEHTYEDGQCVCGAIQTFTVIWKNWNGDELYKDTEVPYGAEAADKYLGETPAKEGDGKHITHTFTGWEPVLGTITADTEYTAQFRQNVSQCYDNDNNHNCDICGDKLSDCADTNNDHNCDVCGDKLSDCADTDKNHTCDVCSGPVGEHKAADGKHTCDYCSQTMSECADKTGDGNHDCDVCGAENITPHTGGTATCLAEATCTECMQSYGEKDPETHASYDVEYVNNGNGTHTKEHACCKVTIETVAHTYTEGECACGDIQKFTITWNIEGVETTSTVSYGTVPAYEGTPAKAGDGKHVTYTFARWNAKPVAATADATYTAEFTTNTSACEGGTATCLSKAVCDICGEEYGEKDPDNHVSEDVTITSNGESTKAHTARYNCCNEVKEVADCVDDGADKDHKCDVCGQENVSACSGGTATCQNKAICTDCKQAYDELDTNNHETDELLYKNNGDGTHEVKHKCCPAVKADAEAHTHNNGRCICGDEPYYLFGYINGANYGCEEDAENAGAYKFVNGELQVTFEQVSYIAVKKGAGSTWYMTDGWLGENQTSATLYDTTALGTAANKLWVPMHLTLTFTLVENEDGTLTLSYVSAPCVHEIHDKAGDCIICGTGVEHVYVDGYCSCGLVQTFTVLWVDENGTVLETDERVEYGATPTYDGTEPTKNATAQYTYTFAGWTPEVSAVTGNVTYKATYSSTVNKYTVTWVDEDGTELEKDVDVEYGTMAEYNSNEPTKADILGIDDEWYTYDFDGWDQVVNEVTGNTSYMAQFRAVPMNGILDNAEGDTYYVQNGKTVAYPGIVRDSNGDYYYFGEDDKAVKNVPEGGQDIWIPAEKTNGKLPEWGYYFDENGVIIRDGDVQLNGIVEEEGVKYYYIDGIRVHMGMFQIGSDWYYVRSNGQLIVDGGYYCSRMWDTGFADGTYYFDADGKMLADGIHVEEDATWYYQGGKRAYVGLIEISGSYYYVKTSGEVICGRTYWITKTNGMMPQAAYTFDADGKMVNPPVVTEHDPNKNGVVAENGSLWYYVNGTLTYAGLIEIEGDYYYVKTNGEVVNGRAYWITNTNGLMNQGLYTFGADGKMVL